MDLMTGGAGSDTFGTSNDLGATGQGRAPSATTLTNNVAAGQTLSFGNGQDRITDFVAGTDKLDVTQAATAPTNLVGGDATVAGANGVTYVLYGTRAGNVFTIAADFNATTAPDAIVIQGDGTTALDATAGAPNSWVSLVGLTQALAAGDFV